MKFLVKLLTFASLAVVGTSAWADKTATLKQNYETYRTDYNNYNQAVEQNDDEQEWLKQTLEESLKNLKKNCNSNCTYFGCSSGSALGENCAKYCNYQAHCLNRYNSKIQSESSFKSYLKTKEKLKGKILDENGVPFTPSESDNEEEEYQEEAPTKKPALKRQRFTSKYDDEEVAPRPKKQKKSIGGTIVAMANHHAKNSVNLVSSKLKKAPSHSSSHPATNDGGVNVEGMQEGNSCVCNLQGLTPAAPASAPAAPGAQAPVPAPAPVVAQAPAPATPVAPEPAPAPAAPPAAHVKTPCELAGEANGMSADDAAANGLC